MRTGQDKEEDEEASSVDLEQKNWLCCWSSLRSMRKGEKEE